MQGEVKKRRKGVVRIASVLLALVACACLLIGINARFSTGGAAGDSARVARFIFTSQGDSSTTLDLSDIKQPGDEVTYRFKVSNANDAAVSEVALRCLFTVDLRGNMPLVCTIAKTPTTDTTGIGASNSPLLQVSLSDAEGSSSDSAQGTTTAANAPSLPAGEKRTEMFDLKVEWPKEKNDARYASLGAVAEAILTVKAEQID